MSYAAAQLISQLIQADPQRFASVMASRGMRPPAAPAPVQAPTAAPPPPPAQIPAPAATPEPGAMGAGALPVVPPGTPQMPPLGPAPSPLPEMDFASLAAGMGQPATPTPDALAGRAPSAPGASVPGGGSFNPQVLALMAAMMQQPQPQGQSLGALIGGK